jgi:fucose 4-O-acetylase-like acetyltransferase
MKESQFGFQYSWSDLKPIRALSVTVVAAQALGAAIGFLVPRFPHWFESLWFGAALATFPAFLVGAVIQARVKPGSLGENSVMVRRLGLIAALLTAFAIAMPFFGFGQ